MNREKFLELVAQSPIVASVQASPGSPLEDVETLCRLAQASLQNGVRVLRAQGEDTIRAFKLRFDAPIIGLIKREYSHNPVYITPTEVEVKALIALGCEVIALDGTDRLRPDGSSLGYLIELIHSAGRLAMADCDSLESARFARHCGADLIGTTLAGYTPSRPATNGPDLALLRELREEFGAGVVIAEGRFSEPWQARAALQIGASAVVIGGALNDPVKQTAAFVNSAGARYSHVAAVDIGGTWMRLAVVDRNLTITSHERHELPESRSERLKMIHDFCVEHRCNVVGVSSGGTIDPANNTVVETKPLIPDHLGTIFEFDGIKSYALNDGLATAWGHAQHPQLAGKRVATLALGTGVGCGVVDRGRIMMGPRGEYARINDLKFGELSFEDQLGGAALTPNPTESQKATATEAAKSALDLIKAIVLPDEIVLAGGVGLADWLVLDGAIRSPYGSDAGIIGAACLALFPPQIS